MSHIPKSNESSEICKDKHVLFCRNLVYRIQHSNSSKGGGEYSPVPSIKADLARLQLGDITDTLHIRSRFRTPPP
ncbi:hypothetical protein EYF80_022677 [Liparis tanakae]|uniref:Uncharacterized protein n=1 Tax=Liparis tanakae TaxID=230148 RepID=A0A4Z2HN20_9TELE|nr:hypothetical protein EYF80_022677 [Liparis tanakae]